MAGRRSFWTWGFEADEPTDAQRREFAARYGARIGRELMPPPIPRIDDIALRPPRIEVPARLAEFVTTDKFERVVHTYGGHSLELLKALRGEFDEPPDAVAHPRTEDELEAVLAWCHREAYVAIPSGGRTTVVWGVSVPKACDGAVVIDLDRLDRVLEIDDVSRAARIQAGIFGPALEDRLRPAGYTLRHFPQSFPWSTLGGWIATRSGGHYATNHTHIDDFVESVRMLTPAGWWESRRLPGSGAGPSPDRLVIGSEGILGVISEAWMRIQKRPRYRATAGVTFATWASAYEAVRRIVQTKLWPANLRLLDPVEAGRAAGLAGDQALLIVGFESAEVPQGAFIQEAVAIARDAGGRVADSDIRVSDGSGEATGREGAVGAWRDSFIGVNAGLTNGIGLLTDTFETAITWDRFERFHAAVMQATRDAVARVCGSGSVSCRFTHVYPDGAAPYYTVLAPGRRGGEIEQWREIKSVACDAIVAAGGTITHHHAVGRDHAPYMAAEVGELGLDVIRATKERLDPTGVMNPGKLLPS